MFGSGRERAKQEAHATAIRHVAQIAGLPDGEVRSALEVIEAQPTLTRDLLIRQIAEAWLEGQRKT